MSYVDYEAIIVRYLDGRSPDAEVRLLDERLRTDPAVRRRFVATAALTGMLAETVNTGAVLPAPRQRRPLRFLAFVAAAAAAIIVLGLSLAWPQPHPASGARLTAWRGGITIIRAGSAVAPTVGLSLEAEDRVGTGNDGGLDLAWDDGSSATLGPAALALVHRPGAPASLSVERGQAACRVTHRPAGATPFAVTAGAWRVVDLGTVFTVALDEHGPRAEVSEGAVEVAGGGQNVRIHAGQHATADEHDRPQVTWLAIETRYGNADHPFAATSRWNLPIAPGTARGGQLPGLATTWGTTAQRIAMVLGGRERHEVIVRGGQTAIGRMPEVDHLDGDLLRRTDVLVVVAPAEHRAWEVAGPELRNDRRLLARRLVEIDLAGAGESGALASGLPACAGMLRGDDLRHGIRHALAIHLPAALLASAGLKAGDRLALAEDFADPDPADPVLVALVQALRRHGALVAGEAAGPELAVDSRLPAASRDALAAAMTRLAPELRVVR